MQPDFDPREYLDYDPMTGVLRWKEGRRHAGREAGCISVTLQGRSYRIVKIGGRQFYAHRLAWRIMTGEWPEHEVDHINRDSLDNRACNLRAATGAQNGQNRGLDKRSVTGVPGVSFHQGRQQYRVLVQANRKRHFLGWFDRLDDAARIARNARNSLSGDFAPSI